MNLERHCGSTFLWNFSIGFCASRNLHRFILLFLWITVGTRCLAQGQPGALSPGSASSPGPIVSSSNGSNVNFSWSQTPGTASYRLNIRDVTTDSVNGPLYYFTNSGASSTTITLTLSSRHAYKWNVYAWSGANATGNATLSTNAWFRFLNPPYLERPGNYSSTPPLPKVLSLTPSIQWDTVPESDGYWFYLSQYPYGPGNIVYNTGFGVSINSVQLPAGVLQPGVSYAWNMTSLWGTDESPTLGRALYFTVDTLPSAPSYVEAEWISNYIVVAWQDNAINESGFGIERKSGVGGTYSQIATVPANTVWFTNNTSLSSGVVYYYRVFAYNGIGNSDYGNETYAPLPALPDAPSNLTASGSQNGISLTWQDNSSNETGFYIQRRQGDSYTYFSIGANQGRYLDESVTQSTQYCYTISATNSAGNSVPTSEACATYNGSSPPPYAIIVGNTTPVTGSVNFYGSASQGTGLQFVWTSSNGQTSYTANPQFQFNSPGLYGVSLTVTDSFLRTSSASVTINVQAANIGHTTLTVAGADPVVLSTGNYIQSRNDLRLSGKGFPFVFNRFYNSKFSALSGKPIGFGWTFSYNRQLVDTGSNVLVSLGDGSTWTFFQTNGAYISEPGFYETLITNADGTWSLTDKAQTVSLFNTNGSLASITDKNGNALTCFYSGGVLSSIQDTAGRPINFTTNSYGCISSMSDPIGRCIQFQYDAFTNLSAVIDANKNTNTYGYDSNHQMTDATNALGVHYIHNQYDQTNFTVTSQCDAYNNWTYFAYDFINRITVQTNVLGKTSTHWFDTNLLETNVLDEANNQQVFFYDKNRNRTYIKDKNGNVTQYAYDSLGNVTNKTDALTNVTTILYDSLNNPISRADALNNVTTFGYDERGNITFTTNALKIITSVQYYPGGLPYIVTDGRGFSTTNYYDSAGNLTNTIDSAGASTTFQYDVAGRRTGQIDALNHPSSFGYDNDDNLTNSVNALGYTNSFIYDANNNRTSSTDPRGATTTNVFDLKDRLIAVLAPLNHTNGVFYDALDRKIATFDALGHQTGYGYDDVGDLTAVTNALNEVTHYNYDPNGNQTSVIDPTTHYITNFFDALNRKVVTIDISISTNLTAYDALGRVFATTNANNQVTQFFYDGINRLTNVVDSANNPVFFDYDNDGNRIHVTDPNGHTWTNVFDGVSRLIEQDDPIGHAMMFHYDSVGNLTNKLTANNDNIVYGYDAINELTNIVYPSGPPVTFAYDSVGNCTNMVDSLGTTTWQLDLLNRLKSITDPYGQTVGNDFDANGNRVTLTYPGNKAVNYGFDALNRMVALTNWLNGVVSYGYDTRGNLTAQTNANETVVAYGYDIADRIVTLTNSASDASVVAAYTLVLDGVGNHRQEANNQPLFPILLNQTNNCTYDLDNRLLTVDDQTVVHNPNGDLTNIGTNTYAYDFEDRLITLTNGLTTGTYVYDGHGNRLSYAVGGQARRCVLDRVGALTQVLVENDTNNAPAAYYVYGLGLEERITPGGTVAAYQYSIQGSTVAITDSGGNVTDSYAYDSFGVLANSDGASPQPFRYLGRYGIVDDGTGLLFARARYFSPQLGRFISKDQLTSRDGDGQGLNRYIYALNNPLLLVDVNGFSGQEMSPTIGTQVENSLYGIMLDLGNETIGVGNGVYLWIQGVFYLPAFAVNTVQHPSSAGQQIVDGFESDLKSLFSGDPHRTGQVIGELLPGLLLDGLGEAGVAETSIGTVDQYALKAAKSDWYPKMKRGFSESQESIWLNAGDVWKYGTTKNPATRYSQTFLQETGGGLIYERQFAGGLGDALSSEKNAILDYLKQNGVLPPGNKIIK